MQARRVRPKYLPLTRAMSQAAALRRTWRRQCARPRGLHRRFHLQRRNLLHSGGSVLHSRAYAEDDGFPTDFHLSSYIRPKSFFEAGQVVYEPVITDDDVIHAGPQKAALNGTRIIWRLPYINAPTSLLCVHAGCTYEQQSENGQAVAHTDAAHLDEHGDSKEAEPSVHG